MFADDSEAGCYRGTKSERVKTLRTLRAGVLDVAYEEMGAPAGIPVILLHGFPYDVRAYDAVAAELDGDDLRIIVPYLRGYGPTRFLATATPRSGQQAALAADLLALMDGLGIDRALLAGYDWGGRAACIVAALFPARVRALVTCGGYNVQNIPASGEPQAARSEHTLWYQYYLHGERGRRALVERRDELTRYLWEAWSPTWLFDDSTFARTAPSFDNPDFVDVVVHSYRHRFGLVAGDPQYDTLERALEAQPSIAVPTISLDGRADVFYAGASVESDRAHFTGPFERREVAAVGHNVPQEAPHVFARAVKDALLRCV